jgi:hypothetical protein
VRWEHCKWRPDLAVGYYEGMSVEIAAETAVILAVVTAPLWIPLAFLIYAVVKWRFNGSIFAWLVAAQALSILVAHLVRSQLRG